MPLKFIDPIIVFVPLKPIKPIKHVSATLYKNINLECKIKCQNFHYLFYNY